MNIIEIGIYWNRQDISRIDFLDMVCVSTTSPLHGRFVLAWACPQSPSHRPTPQHRCAHYSGGKGVGASSASPLGVLFCMSLDGTPSDSH